MTYYISLKYRGNYRNETKEFDTHEKFEEYYDKCIARGDKVIGVNY